MNKIKGLRRKLLVALVGLFVIGGTIGAYAWWDILAKDTDGQLEMSYGVRLVLDDQTTEDQGMLVPAGSYFASAEGFTTEYSFEYKLYLEDDMGSFDLNIDLENLLVGGVNYLAASTHRALYVTVNVNGVDYVVAVENTSLLIEDAFNGTEEVIVTVNFSLASQAAVAEPAFGEADYQAVAGQTITFDIAFEVK